MRRYVRPFAGGLAGLLMGLVVAILLGPEQYVSTAVVRVAPAQVPGYVAASFAPELTMRFPGIVQQILSRSSLTGIITARDLYGADRARMPLEEVIARMKRNDVQITRMADPSLTETERRTLPAFEIRFSYPDRYKARDVTQDLTGLLISEHLREMANIARSVERFLTDMSEQAAIDWRLASQATGVSTERKAADIAVAKQHYESLRMKLAQAKLEVALEKRQQGGTLELLEPASLPRQPVFPRIWLLPGGFLLGLLWATLTSHGRGQTPGSPHLAAQ